MNELTKRLQGEIKALNSLNSIFENKSITKGYQFVFLEETDRDNANIEHNKKFFKVSSFLKDIYSNLDLGNKKYLELEVYNDIYVKENNHTFRILYNIDKETLDINYYLQFQDINFNYNNMELEKVEYSDNKYTGTNKLELLWLSKKELKEIEKWCI